MIDHTIVDRLAESLLDLSHYDRASAVAQWNRIGHDVADRLAAREAELRQADPPALDDVAASREYYAGEPAERLLWRLAVGRA